MRRSTRTGRLALLVAGLGLVLACPKKAELPATVATPPVALAWQADLPVYDHIVIVVEENKDYDDIIGNPAAPYINGVLKREGANLTRFFAEEHFSEGNYFWLFSGDNQGVGFTDRVPSARNHPGYPFGAPNLGAALIRSGRSFKGYSEDLPTIGFTGSRDGLYARKHVPWISFANVPNGKIPSESSNLRFADFPSGPSQYHNLPTVAFVIPNMVDDMHNGKLQESIAAGDRWLQKNIDPYYQWAKTHNSLLILTFDESEDRHRYTGLTDPAIRPDVPDASGHDRRWRLDVQNRIATLFAGAHIKAGDYPEGPGVTHVNVLRTIEAMYGLPAAGRQQADAVRAGIGESPITDVFVRRP